MSPPAGAIPHAHVGSPTPLSQAFFWLLDRPTRELEVLPPGRYGEQNTLPRRSWLSHGYPGECSEEPTEVTQSTKASPTSGAPNSELHIIPELAKVILKQGQLAVPVAWDDLSFSILRPIQPLATAHPPYMTPKLGDQSTFWLTQDKAWYGQRCEDCAGSGFRSRPQALLPGFFLTWFPNTQDTEKDNGDSGLAGGAWQI